MLHVEVTHLLDRFFLLQGLPESIADRLRTFVLLKGSPMELLKKLEAMKDLNELAIARVGPNGKRRWDLGMMSSEYSL